MAENTVGIGVSVQYWQIVHYPLGFNSHLLQRRQHAELISKEFRVSAPIMEIILNKLSCSRFWNLASLISTPTPTMSALCAGLLIINRVCNDRNETVPTSYELGRNQQIYLILYILIADCQALNKN